MLTDTGKINNLFSFLESILKLGKEKWTISSCVFSIFSMLSSWKPCVPWVQRGALQRGFTLSWAAEGTCCRKNIAKGVAGTSCLFYNFRLSNMFCVTELFSHVLLYHLSFLSLQKQKSYISEGSTNICTLITYKKGEMVQLTEEKLKIQTHCS